MSRRIKMLMAESRKGSINAISQLSEAIGSDVGLFVEALPILFQHLRIADIPPEPFPWADDVKNAQSGKLTICCLKCLGTCIPRYTLGRWPTVRSTVIQPGFLDKLWPAPAFLLARLQRGIVSLSEWEFQRDIYPAIIDIFLFLSNDPAILPMLLSQPEVITTLAGIWILEVEVAETNSKSASTILAAAAMTVPDSVPFPKGILGSEQDVTSFLLNQLDERLRADKPNVSLIQVLIVLMLEWSYDSNQPHDSFVKAGSIQSICKVLRQMSSPRTFCRLDANPSAIPMVNQVIQTGIHYLAFCIRRGGASAAAKAIDHHMIQSVMRSRQILQRLSGEGRRKMDNEFADLFPMLESLLVYPEVLRRAVRSLRVVLPRVNRDSALSDATKSSTAFLGLWRSFVSSVEIRTKYKHEKDWSESLRCHNPSHNEIGFSGNSFRACSRCHESYYCSRACQKAHWKTGEYTTCNMKIMMEDPSPYGLAQRRDYVFLRDMVQHDLKRAIDDGSLLSARQLYQRQHPDVDARTLVALFDYFQGPYSMTIISESAFREAEDINADDDINDWDINDLFEEAKRGLGFLVVSKVRVAASDPWLKMKLLPF